MSAHAPLTLPADFLRLVRVGADNECWPWVGETTAFGYGQGPHGLSHIWAYRLHYGAPRKGYQVYHAVCANRLCCNPKHMKTRKRW